jgi:hypothetical protein
VIALSSLHEFNRPPHFQFDGWTPSDSPSTPFVRQAVATRAPLVRTRFSGPGCRSRGVSLSLRSFLSVYLRTNDISLWPLHWLPSGNYCSHLSDLLSARCLTLEPDQVLDRSRRTTSAGNRKRLGWEGDRGRDSRSKCCPRTRNSVPISINASFVRISILLRASLRHSSAFVCSSFGVGQFHLSSVEILRSLELLD